MSQFDIVIVGGGMVGATLACMLAGETDLSIAVIDNAAPLKKPSINSFDIRVSAITRASENIFKNIGVWEKIRTLRISPYRDMHVWDAKGNGVLHFDSADLAEPTLGHIIENRVMQYALQQRLKSFENVTVIAPASCKKMIENDGQVVLLLENDKVITASLLVGADGSRSWVRQQANIMVRGWDYDQAALVTYVKTEKPHQETAWQRFMPNGPLAFLPLTEGYSSIVWSTIPEHADELKTMDETEFKKALCVASDNILGEILSCAERGVFPLRFFAVENYIKPNLALVGDAAHTIHPLAGQGVNLGLADAAALAQTLVDASNEAKAINSKSVLRRYERWRKADNLAMMVAMDGLKNMFGSELGLIRELRNSGMNIVNNLPIVKNTLIKQAMGLTGDLSRFASFNSL